MNYVTLLIEEGVCLGLWEAAHIEEEPWKLPQGERVSGTLGKDLKQLPDAWDVLSEDVQVSPISGNADFLIPHEPSHMHDQLKLYFVVRLIEQHSQAKI